MHRKEGGGGIVLSHSLDRKAFAGFGKSLDKKNEGVLSSPAT